MTSPVSSPENVNFLSPLGYKVTLARTPSTSFFAQTVGIPGISIQETYQPNPFVKIPQTGDHIEYEELTITFMVAEDLSNWLEIHNWMRALGFPENFDEIKLLTEAPAGDPRGVESDISVTILNSAMNPNYVFNFKSAFPISLSGFEMSSTRPDVDYVTASARFRYRSYDITKL